jgi:hypothetical protein
MHTQQKESYVQPELVKHELLRDITGTISGTNGCLPGKVCPD